ncbi:MAG TPA: hypothetical protein VMW65_08095 [Chloroflexota bacterium]|nr:hypothetical protein [Chloroflexota bacterium]
MVFVRSRRVGLPQVDEAGEFSPLNIPTTSGIAEVTHVRFFDDNLIAADFNFHGPPVSALSSYFRRTCNPVCPNVKFAPLLSQVALDQMDSMDTIKLARVRVARPYIATLQAASASLNASFASAAEVGGAEDFELVLRPQKYTGGTLNAIAVKQLWRRLRGLNEEHLAILELKVEGRINDTDVLIDLLSDKLIVKKQVIQINERSRAIDPASAFAAIGEAFDEVESIARMAPALGFGIPDDA